MVLFQMFCWIGSHAAVAQLDNYPFVSLGQRDWLIRKNFDTDFYWGTDSLINVHLTKAIEHRNDPMTGFMILLNGRAEIEDALESLELATTRRYDQLLNGQTFHGSESFRGEEQKTWYARENFYVRYYDGQSPDINNLLDEAYLWRNKANRHWEIAAITNVGGIGLVLAGAFSAAFGAYDAVGPFIATGAVVHFSSYAFASSAIIRKDKAKSLLSQASRRWFRKLNDGR